MPPAVLGRALPKRSLNIDSGIPASCCAISCAHRLRAGRHHHSMRLTALVLIITLSYTL